MTTTQYSTVGSAALLDVALELAEVIGAMSEIPSGTLLLGDDDDDKLSPEVRAALTPLARRMERAMVDAMRPMVRAELDLVKTEVRNRLDHRDAMLAILREAPGSAASAGGSV